MGDTAEGELAGVPAGQSVSGGMAVRVLLDDGREVVAALPKHLLRSTSIIAPGERVEVRLETSERSARVLRFLNNRGPRSPLLRIGGWREGANPVQFIVVARQYTGVDLRTAKDWLDRLQAGGEVDLSPPDARDARRLGVELLRAGDGGVVLRAELVYSDGRPAERLTAPVPPPVFPCPACGEPLKNRDECARCGWFKYPPGDAGRWGMSEACPRCGFSYRWDGACCSHCGFGSRTTTV
jgi:hypothetical protein